MEAKYLKEPLKVSRKYLDFFRKYLDKYPDNVSLKNSMFNCLYCYLVKKKDNQAMSHKRLTNVEELQ